MADPSFAASDVWICIFQYFDIATTARLALSSRRWAFYSWEFMENVTLSEETNITHLLTDNAHMKHKFKNMRKLALNGNTSFGVSDEFLGLATLRFPTLTHLYIRSNNLLTDQGLAEALLEVQNLQVLELMSCALLTGEVIADHDGTVVTTNTLAGFHGWSLSVSLCPCFKSQALAEAIAENSAIKRLALFEQNLTVPHLRMALAALRGLRSLEIIGSPMVSDFALEPIEKMAALEHIRLSKCNGISGEIFTHLQPSAMLMLRTLDVAAIVPVLVEAQVLFKESLAELQKRFNQKLIVTTEYVDTPQELFQMMQMLNNLRQYAGKKQLRLA